MKMIQMLVSLAGLSALYTAFVVLAPLFKVGVPAQAPLLRGFLGIAVAFIGLGALVAMLVLNEDKIATALKKRRCLRPLYRAHQWLIG